jgi:ribosomal protein S18 acetylase RimI-like enzyme
MRVAEDRPRAHAGDAHRIRLAEPRDLLLLREMLFEAAFWRTEAPRPALETGLARPDLAKLLRDWGRAGDTAVVAESPTGSGVGAAWFRFWSAADHSYGFVAPEIPELGLAVRAELRGLGLGTRLLRALLAQAAQAGIAQLSLSVELENPALRLYERSGFRRVGRVGGAWTLVADARA